MREATLACGAYEFLHKSELTEATLARLVRLAVMQAHTFHSLRESETRFRSLTALTSDWFWETDREHRFVTMPSRVTAVTGLGPQAYVGKPRWEVPGLSPLAGDWAAHQQALARRESFRDLQLVQVRTDGSRCYLQISGEPMYDADGGFRGYRGSAKDVTARTQEENLLRLEHAVTQRLAVSESATQAAQDVMRAVCEVEGWGCGRYFALDEAAGVMRFEQAWARPGGRFDGFVASSRGQTYARGVGLVGRVWASGRPVWVKDAASDARVAFSALAREHGVHSALVFPVTAGDRVVGAVSISSDTIREPDARLLGTMRVIGSQLGLFLQRCRAEEALRASESRLRAIMDNDPQCVKLLDAEGRLIDMNPAGLRMIEADDVAPLRGHCVEGLVVPEHRAAFRELTQRVARGGEGALEFEIVGLKGTRRWLETRAVPLRDEASGERLVLGITSDITQRRRSEAALRASELRFRTLTELTSDWYWEQDAELRFVSTGGTSDARGGITPEAHVGLRRWELPRTEIVSQSWDEHRQVLEARQPFTELLLRRTSESGEVRYVSVAGRPIFDARGIFSGYRGLAKDVTTRIASELELRRFRAALDAAGDMVFLVDARTSSYLDFNETACRILGYTRDEMLGMDTEGVRLDRSREQLLDDYRELAAAPGASLTTVGTYRRKDGSTFPVEVTRRLLETRDGAVVVATARDLTERTRAEQRQAAHHRYQERIARFGQAALAKRDPAELAAEAAQTLLEALHADGGGVCGARDVGARSRAAHGRRRRRGGGDSRVLACAESDPVLQVLRTGRAAFAQGAGLSFAWARRLRTAALVPVRGERGVRGALCVFFEEAEGFGAEDSLNFIEAAASVLSTALQRIDSEGRLAYLAQFDPLTGLPNRTLLADRFSQMIGQAGRRGSRARGAVRRPGRIQDGERHARPRRRRRAPPGGRGAPAVERAFRRHRGAHQRRRVRDRARRHRTPGRRGARGAEDHRPLLARGAGPRQGGVRHGERRHRRLSGRRRRCGDPDPAPPTPRCTGRSSRDATASSSSPPRSTSARARARRWARSCAGRSSARSSRWSISRSCSSSSRRPRGAEALLRWKHPERGMVSPAEFIPVLEETGLIVPVGEWVIAQACKDLKAWQAAGLDVAPVSVNLSARQFRLQDLDARIKSLVSSAGVDPGLFELEITESQLMQDPDHAIRVMRALCDAGMRIAIDDFGTGYSSLAYLRRFPIVSLKIDRSFIKDMASDGGDAAIVRAIIEMAHSVGFTVTAEGVETEEQAALLRLLRCDQAQGFLFARPMPAEELPRFYAA